MLFLWAHKSVSYKSDQYQNFVINYDPTPANDVYKKSTVLAASSCCQTKHYIYVTDINQIIMMRCKIIPIRGIPEKGEKITVINSPD